MSIHHSIDYIEFTAPNLEEVKKFYTNAFEWEFTDYGETYTAFKDERLEGGFEKGKGGQTGGPLVILYSEDLEASLELVQEHGGTITKAIFGFPGGRRFHFTDPARNELAVWSDKGI